MLDWRKKTGELASICGTDALVRDRAAMWVLLVTLLISVASIILGSVGWILS